MNDLSLKIAVGAPPGHMPHHEEAEPTEVELICYDADTYLEEPCICSRLPDTHERKVTWVNVEGLRDHTILQQVTDHFQIHRLAAEDILVHQRPKVEEYQDHLLIIVPMPHPDLEEMEQLSIFLGRDFLVTFQDGTPGDCFEPVRVRIRESRGQIRTRGPDYLAYALLDAVIDSYFPIVDRIGEEVDDVEEDVLNFRTGRALMQIRALKRKVMNLKRIVRPLSECLAVLSRGYAGYIEEDTRLYFRDCLDHTRLLSDALEVQRDLVTTLMDVYLSTISQRMNEIMKTLTIMSTIFIPLSFIAGLYGMNFNPERSPMNMPELNWKYGYPFALCIMFGVALTLLIYFYRKGWLFSSEGGEEGS